MKILLIDVDSKIPNLALMKLSSYHKIKGDNVELIKIGLEYYPSKNKNKIINAIGYDHVYASIIFQTNKDKVKIENCKTVDLGGTGFDIFKKLPKDIDDMAEDYSIYNEQEISYGFITRGCIRNCSFCFVPKKEGYIYRYRNVCDIVKFKKTIFMDNNILALDNHKEILQEIVNKKIKCQFNQGLDIRLLDDENALLLSQIKYIGEYFFAFDDINSKNIIEEKYLLFKRYIENNWKCKFFIYCNPNTPIKEVVDRVEWCKNNKALPYLMRDITCWESENNNFYIDLASWCNQPNCFKKMSFAEFMDKRTKNIARRNKSVSLYLGLLS